MKSVFRAFIAIDMSTEVLRRIDETSAELQSRLGALPVRWIPADNVHLTLKFLGDVSVTFIDRLSEIIDRAAAGYDGFEISVGSIGVFPNPRRPRVIWLGVEAPPVLTSIQRIIDQETTRLGYENKDQAFTPHLTIGRVSRSANYQEVKKISDILEKETVGFLGATRVQKICLYRSDLKSEGAEYAIVHTAALKE